MSRDSFLTNPATGTDEKDTARVQVPISQAEHECVTSTTTGNNKEEKETRYRQYLIDRTNGTSKITVGGKPPCFACYMPVPVVWFSKFIEQNCVFEWLGKFGCVSPENLRARKICIGFGLILNILGTGAAIYTCLALSLNYDTLYTVSFTHGALSMYKPIANSTSRTSANANLRIGMRGVAIDWYSPQESAYQEVIAFDEFCDIGGSILGQGDGVVDDNSKCDACAGISGQITRALIISLVMCFPSLTTDVLRLYPGYDCNCQKVFAGFTSIISILFAFYTILVYQNTCFDSFDWGAYCVLDSSMVDDPSDYIPSFEIDKPASSEDCPPEYITVNASFWLGPGWGALLATGFFKIMDTLLNLAIPTPTICRDREEQRQYELLAQKEQEQQDDADDVPSQKNDD